MGVEPMTFQIPVGRSNHMLTLAVWQDTCHTYKNLVYDPAHQESPINLVPRVLSFPFPEEDPGNEVGLP